MISGLTLFRIARRIHGFDHAGRVSLSQSFLAITLA